MLRKLTIAACLAAACPAWIVAASLPVAADSYVQASMPAQNFGSLPQLLVDSDHWAYLKFDVASVLPQDYNGGTIERAILYLYAGRVTTPGGISLHRACTGWSETALTYSGRPIECPTGESVFNVTESNRFVAVEITRLAQAWIDGTLPNDGIILGTSVNANGAAFFDSKENTATGHVARLEITFTGAPGPLGPTGPRGAQGPRGPAGGAILMPVTCSGGLVSHVNADGSSGCGCAPIIFGVTARATGNSGGIMRWQGSDHSLGSGSCTMTITEPSGRVDTPTNPSWRLKSTGPYGRCAIIGAVPDCVSDAGYLGTNDYPTCTTAYTDLYPRAQAYVFCN